MTTSQVPDADITLHEMLQIMDVARAVHEEQAAIECYFESQYVYRDPPLNG